MVDAFFFGRGSRLSGLTSNEANREHWPAC